MKKLWVVRPLTHLKLVTPQTEAAMTEEASLRRRSVKAFLIVIKYLPYAIMLLGMVRTFSCIFGKESVALTYIGGTSYLVILFMLLTSYVFDFCSYHRVPIYYILINDTLVLYDYYIGIPISNARLLDVNLVLVGATVLLMTILYCKEKRHGRFNTASKGGVTTDN